jgi:CRP-like cAMP-binding protein
MALARAYRRPFEAPAARSEVRFRLYSHERSMSLSHASNPLIAKLQRFVSLSSAEKDAIVALPFILKQVGDNQDIVRERDKPTQCAIVVQGLLCRYKTLDEGARQIFSFHIRGDIPDLDGLHLEVMDHSIAAMEQSTLAFVPHESLIAMVEDFPRIGVALWRESVADGAIYREWLVNVADREAYQRTAHLICEMYVRLRGMSLAPNGSFHFPVTQEELGDAVGLSAVHVNRTLQHLRREGLITWKNRSVTILDWDHLQKAAGFDPLYLHQLEPEMDAGTATAQASGKPFDRKSYAAPKAPRKASSARP